MTYLFPSRGCVYEAHSSGRAAGSGFRLDPELKGFNGAPILIQGVDGMFTDIISAKMAIGGAKQIDIFGQGFGNLELQCAALLGEVGNTRVASNYASIIAYGLDNSISANGTPVTLSMPGTSRLSLYITRWGFGRSDPAFNVQYFTLGGVTAPPPA